MGASVQREKGCQLGTLKYNCEISTVQIPVAFFSTIFQGFLPLL